MTSPPPVPPADTSSSEAPPRPDPPPDRVVLVGFMAAGKSTVGRLLARRLGYRFVDLDRLIEERAARPIPEIFRLGGEERFRELEAEVTRELDPAGRTVVAAGGGWMAREELRERWPGAVRIWLRVRPATVVERLRGDVDSRPMLDPDDPAGAIRRLLERRRQDYARAELAVETDDLTPEQVAAEIQELLEST